MNIPFNKPYLTGAETTYINDAVKNGHISGNGTYTQRCQVFFEEHFGVQKCLLTTSCTDALEMAALLFDIKPGDEVIMPSYTFVSTALAFDRQGAKVVFADCRPDYPVIDENAIEALITPNTKAIVVVHYAGIACNMEAITALAAKYGLWLAEDAAMAIGSTYKLADGSQKALGTFGHLACFSFHETKNIQCGEGGLLVINHEAFVQRAEILWEKGTNRAAFKRGESHSYGWLDTGSSFLPSDMTAAFLFAQTQHAGQIIQRRLQIWHLYHSLLEEAETNGFITRPYVPEYANHNGHTYYILCSSKSIRDSLIAYLNAAGVNAVFHYLPLHQSAYYRAKFSVAELPNTLHFSENLLRLPLYYELDESQLKSICTLVNEFFKMAGLISGF